VSLKDTSFTATADGHLLVWERGRPLARLDWSGDAAAPSSSAASSSSSAAQQPPSSRKRRRAESAADADSSTAVSGGDAIVQLLVIGDVVLSLHADGALRSWDGKAAAAAVRAAGASGRVPSSYPPPRLPAGLLLSTAVLPPGSGAPTGVLHPPTYVNKVAVGTTTGGVAVVNIRTGRTLHVCAVVPPGSASVTALAATGALDVIGVGTSDGRVVLHNLRADARVAAFAHAAADARSSPGAVTALAFPAASGNTLTLPVAVSATEAGGVAVWDLAQRALLHAVPAAHGGRVVFAAFVPGQPVVVTAGADNAVSMWQLDTLTGSPSLLRGRTGHTDAPRIIRYYHGASGSGSGGGGSAVASLSGGADASVCEIASAGGGADRSLRLTHTALARQCIELSQGHLTARARTVGCHPNALKLPPITALAVSDRRHGQWADVVTAHAGSSRAYLWSWARKALDERALQLPQGAHAPADGGASSAAAAADGESVTAVALSACGHYAVLGGSSGTVCKFNLQSASRRGTFPRNPANEAALTAKGPKVGPRYAGDIGAPDRDVGKGGASAAAASGRPTARLHLVDSIDTALLRVTGIAPAPHLLPPPQGGGKKQAAAQKGAASASASSSSSAAATDAAQPEPLPARHTSAVTGLGVDALNSTLVSVDAAGWVLFWDFTSGGGHELRGGLRLPSPAVSLTLHREAGLAAVGCDDFSVRVLDVASRRLVRSFAGHGNRLADVAFSPDARWLATASVDRSVRVWDVPTGRCIDWLAFAAPPTSLAWAPTGEYLVTAHAGSPGLYLWANKAHFGGSVSAAAAGADGSGVDAVGGGPAAPVHMDLPGGRPEGDEGAGGGDDDVGAAASSSASSSAAATGDDASSSSAAPVAVVPRPDSRLTLSGLAPSAWVYLHRLETIAARNKPAAPPTKPASAPFFLPTTGGLAPAFVAPPSGAAAAGAAAGATAGVDGEWSSAWQDADDAEGAGAAADADDGSDASAAQLLPRLTAHGRHLTSEGTGAAAAALGLQGRVSRTRLAELLLAAFPRTFAVMEQDGGGDDDEEGDAAAADAAALVAVSDHLVAVSDHLVAVSDHLASLPPPALDAQVRSLCLGPADTAGVALLASLLRYLAWAVDGAPGKGLASVGRYELAHGHIGLVLEAHHDTLGAVAGAAAVAGDAAAGGDEELPAPLKAALRGALGAVRAAQAPEGAALRAQLDKALAVIAFLL
jgi:U3 small nucleolar RNA-associated protein 21